MMTTICKLTLLFVAFACYACTTAPKVSLIYERLSPCQSDEYDSTCLCGKLSVFENTETKSGRKIDLNIVVIPAIHNNNNVPIFCLEGGPGIGATVGGSYYADTINFYRLHHDVVLVDVRGTGQSNPLHCRQLQYKENLQEHLGEMYPTEAVKGCYDSLSKLADLTQYTTSNMAADMEEVRQWLGYNKIGLFGLSFGTRLAQVYMKMFPNSVESSVLWSPTTTYSRMPLYHAQFAEESIEKLFTDCKSDSLCKLTFPNVREEFRELMTRGKQKAFQYRLKQTDGTFQDITISWNAFQTKIRSLMYTPSGLRKIPFIIHQSYIGQWQHFISLYPTESSYDDFIAEGLYLCVTCAEDVPFISKKEVDSLTHDTFMGDYRVVQQQNACNNWVKGTIPSNYFEPLSSDIPTLVFSGYMDPVTPPSMAAQIIKTLPHSFMISIPTMSHIVEGLSNPECLDKMATDFFNNSGIKPNDDCVRKMLPSEYKTQ